MKKHLLLYGALAASALSIFAFNQSKEKTDREKWHDMLAEHPFNQRDRYNYEEGEGEEEEEGKDKEATPELAYEQDYLRTMDPALGRPAPERLASILANLNGGGMEISSIPGTANFPWVERGPDNVGGRTRALAWDPNDPNEKKVWAGGVSGGLWYNPDITSASSNWVPVDNFWDNIAITCIAFDPTNTSTIYVGTGEGYGTGASRGAGIWKSTNGGTSWTQLSSTTGYYYINDLVVRNENGTGVVYAAVDGLSYKGAFHGLTVAGLKRSTNGGSSWSSVSPTIPNTSIKFIVADLEIGADNTLWAGTRANSYSSSDRGGGRVLSSSNGTTWTVSDAVSVTNGRGRVEVACAPSDQNVVYALVENDGKAHAIRKTTNKGSSWSSMNEPSDADNGIPSTDFTRGQAWYDLILAVDPNDEDVVVIGGIDLFRSTNGASSWSQISKWSNNNNLAGLSCSYVHADQHALVFKPGSSNVLLSGNDGGVFYTSNLSNAASSDVFDERNKNYNVTQFYALAMNPTLGSDIFLAGAQDNGTQRYASSGLNSTTRVRGGDGAYCFIDQTDGSIAISSYVYNTYKKSTNSGSNFNTDLIDDQSTGKFINPADYDDNNNVLYSCRNSTSIWRIRNVSGTPASPEVVTISGMSSEASHIRSSPYSTTVFVGTDDGEVFKVTDANGSSSSSDITGSGMPAGTISCIEVGADDDELLVTFFNYGITSVWYTSDGGSNWVNKEGNLPDMPVRWALFNPFDRDEVLLATELGVWHTTNLAATSPSWASNSVGMANVRVDMLQIRDSDKLVAAATFGRGVFTSDAFTVYPVPTAAFEADRTILCLTDTLELTDTSSSVVLNYEWSISPTTFNYVAGTNANSASPKILFTSNGSYNVKLKVSNASGADSVTYSNYITVGGVSLPFSEDWENASTYSNWDVVNPDDDVTWLIYTTSGNGTSSKSAGVDNFNYSNAQNVVRRDGLVSPLINLSGYGNISLTFKHAYRRYSSTFQDSMAISVSADCGNTWTRVFEKRETQTSSPFAYITNSNTTSAFTPGSSADWCGNTGYGACNTVDLSAYSGQAIRIMFENISGFGNNLYIDDISVTGTPSGPPPVADFASDITSTCIPQGVHFYDSSSNNPTSWTWSFSPSTVSYLSGTSANSQNPVVKFDAPGTYSVTLTAQNPSGSDAEVKSNFITVSAGLIASINISTDNSSVCDNADVVFRATVQNGGSSPTYQWKVNNSPVGSNSDSLVIGTLVDGDIVTCSLISNDACVQTANVNSNSLPITVKAAPSVSLVFSDNISCIGEAEFTLTGGSPAGGVYSGAGVSGGKFNPANAGVGNHTITYSYTSNGCTGATTATMIVNNVPNKPQITANGSQLTCSETAIFYQWYLNGSPISGANFKQHNAQASGEYTVEITESGCKNISDPFTHWMANVSPIASVELFKVYPNPNKGEVNLSLTLNTASKFKLTLYDINGKLIQSEDLSFAAGGNTYKLESKLAPGSYTLVLSDGQAEIKRSIVVVR